MKPLTYLAVPYSHEDQTIMDARFVAVTKAAGYLMNKGELIFSPITHGHPIAHATGLPTNYEFWERYCRAYLSHCHKIIVLKLNGWGESVGVKAELKIAHELGITVEFLEPGYDL